MVRRGYHDRVPTGQRLGFTRCALKIRDHRRRVIPHAHRLICSNMVRIVSAIGVNPHRLGSKGTIAQRRQVAIGNRRRVFFGPVTVLFLVGPFISLTACHLRG